MLDVDTEAVPRHLIDAGLDCLATYGLSKTAISDVADRAGVSRATAYRAFGSKQQMLAVLVGAELDRFFTEAESEFAVDGPLEVRLAAAFEFALNWLRQHPLVRHMMRHEPDQLVPVIVEQPDGIPYLNLAASRLAQMIQDDPMAAQLATPPEAVAELMVRITVSLILAPTTFSDPGRIAANLVHGITRRA